MKTKRKRGIAVAVLFVTTILFLPGCQKAAPSQSTLGEKGILTLSVNPEIQIEYDREGLVTALTGKNEDGQKVVAAYGDYSGKPCGEVLKDLIGRIYAAGYFVDDIDGNKKSIVLQLEPGSVLPQQDFLVKIRTDAQNAVKDLQLSSGMVTIDDEDYDNKYAKNGQPSPYITLERAKEIALTSRPASAPRMPYLNTANSISMTVSLSMSSNSRPTAWNMSTISML